MKDTSKLKSLLFSARLRQAPFVTSKIDNLVATGEWGIFISDRGSKVFFDKAKCAMRKEAFELEKKHAGVLADCGCKVFLLKENHKQYGKKNIDAIVDGVFVELKHIDGTRATSGKAYGSGLEQCENVSLYISSKAPDFQDEYLSKLRGTAMASKRKKGLLIVYFEKTKELLAFDMSAYNK